jgi:predicted nucleic acid-binding protein
MAVERILDASVLASALFPEARTDRARAWLTTDTVFLAPDLLLVEMASIAAKKVRRGAIDPAQAEAALDQVGELITRSVPSRDHYRRAYALAADHGFSAYDGLYLALAEARGSPVLTADEKLVRRAGEVGLAALVEAL